MDVVSYSPPQSPSTVPSTCTSSTEERRVRVDGRKYVQKGTLREDELIQAKVLAKCQDGLTEEEKKRRERRAANRLSAFQSRQRRKTIIQDLQKTLARIAKDNDEQMRENLDLRNQLDTFRKENRELRAQFEALTNRLVTPPKPEERFIQSASSVAQDNLLHLAQLRTGDTTSLAGLAALKAILAQNAQPQQQQSPVQSLLQGLHPSNLEKAALIINLLQHKFPVQH